MTQHEWDPDADDGWDWIRDGVPGCEFCAAGEVRTHTHLLYRDAWRPLIEVPLPDDQGEQRDATDQAGGLPPLRE